MKITLQQAEEIVWEDGSEGIQVVARIRGEDRRWTHTDSIIIASEGKLYRLLHEVGLTEGQEMTGIDAFPQFNSSKTEVELPEVVKKEKTIVQVYYE